MRATRFLLGVMLCLSWMIVAQAADATSFDKGLLWKIERKGVAPSYVFGTIHSEDERVLAVPPEVGAAFAGAGIFVMEMVMNEQAIRSMGSRMMFADGKTLKQVLSAPLYARSLSAMTAYGMPEAMLQQMKPWAVSMTLSMPRPRGGLFLDLLLMQAAVEQGKTVAGLETADEQLSLFDSLSLRDQITMLEDTLNYLPEIDAMFARMHELYLARDLGGLVALSEELESKGNRELGRRLMVKFVDERNRRMASRVETYLKKGNAFVAVGSLHLPGREGVLNLLAKKGYRVSAVY